MKRTAGWSAVVSMLLCPLAFGQSFGPHSNVSNNAGESALPTVAVKDSTTRYVIWSDDTADRGSFRLLWDEFTLPNGPSSGNQTIPGVNSLDEALFARAVTDRNGNVHVVFMNQILGRYEIYYTRFNGSSWSALEPVSANTGDSLTPALAVDSSGQVHVVWSDDTVISDVFEIYYSKRSALGLWSTPVNVSRRPGSGSTFPDVVVTSDGLPNVTWVDTTSGVTSIFFSRGNSGGTFGAVRNVSGELGSGPIVGSGPALAVGPSNRLHLVWSGLDSASGTDIFYAHATGPGYGFKGMKNISNNTGASIFPRVGIDSADQAHVVWADNTIDPDYDILYSRVLPAGASTQPLNVEATPGRSLQPDIKVDTADGLHVCWMDDLGIPPAVNFEVLCTIGTASIAPITTCSTNPAPDAQCGGFVSSANPTVDVILTATDGDGVKSITWTEDNGAQQSMAFSCSPGSSPQQHTFPHSIGSGGSHTIRFWGTDCQNNVESTRTCSFKTDATPPVTTPIPGNASCSANCPVYSEPVEVSFTAVDPSPGSGIKMTKYTIDGGPEMVYGGPFTVSTEGSHTITFYSVDGACNIEATQVLKFTILQPLKVEITRPKNGAVYMNDTEIVGPITTLDKTTVRLGESSVTAGTSAVVIGNQLTVQAKVTAPDGSMIDLVTLHVDGIPRRTDGTNKPSGSTYSLTYPLAFPVLQGTQIVKVVALDVNGRKGSAEVAFILTQ